MPPVVQETHKEWQLHEGHSWHSPASICLAVAMRTPLRVLRGNLHRHTYTTPLSLFTSL